MNSGIGERNEQVVLTAAERVSVHISVGTRSKRQRCVEAKGVTAEFSILSRASGLEQRAEVDCIRTAHSATRSGAERVTERTSMRAVSGGADSIRCSDAEMVVAAIDEVTSGDVVVRVRGNSRVRELRASSSALSTEVLRVSSIANGGDFLAVHVAQSTTDATASGTSVVAVHVGKRLSDSQVISTASERITRSCSSNAERHARATIKARLSARVLKVVASASGGDRRAVSLAVVRANQTARQRSVLAVDRETSELGDFSVVDPAAERVSRIIARRTRSERSALGQAVRIASEIRLRRASVEVDVAVGFAVATAHATRKRTRVRAMRGR